jgi:glucosamine-6-phosphate deaminase
MGEDGHTFGFNFPGTSSYAKTRLVWITGRTRSNDKRLTGFETPDYAITLGLTTGMAAKEILFLFSGERKAEILRKVIYGPEIRQDIPATRLRDHPLCHWIVDEKLHVVCHSSLLQKMKRAKTSTLLTRQTLACR